VSDKPKRKRVAPVSRCQVTEKEIAIAQTVWTGQYSFDLSMAMLRPYIANLETREARRDGLKKAKRRASILDVLTFRNAIVRTTMVALQHGLDPTRICVGLSLPSMDTETQEIGFGVSNGRCEIYLHQSGRAVSAQGLCRGRYHGSTDDVSSGDFETFEPLVWSLLDSASWRDRLSVRNEDSCRSYGRVDPLTSNFHTHDLRVWFDRYKEPTKLDARGENFTVEFFKRSNEYGYYREFHARVTDPRDMQRAAHLTNLIDGFLPYCGPIGVTKLLAELGYNLVQDTQGETP